MAKLIIPVARPVNNVQAHLDSIQPSKKYVLKVGGLYLSLKDANRFVLPSQASQFSRSEAAKVVGFVGYGEAVRCKPVKQDLACTEEITSLSVFGTKR